MAYYINLTTKIKGQGSEMTTIGRYASRTEAQANLPLLRALYPGRKYSLKVSQRATRSWYLAHGTIQKQVSGYPAGADGCATILPLILLFLGVAASIPLLGILAFSAIMFAAGIYSLRNH